MSTVRLLPLLTIAALSLFALKAAGLMFSGGYMLSGAAPASAQNTGEASPGGAAGKALSDTADEAQKPRKTASAGDDGGTARDSSAANDKRADAMTAKNGGKRGPDASGANDGDAEQKLDAVPAGPGVVPRGAEVEVLQSLAKRRKELDQRARELELRENLLKAAENRVEARIAELKGIEQRIETEFKERENIREEEYKKLVVMYSRMKPKHAAKIFNRLDIDVLTHIIRKMKPASTSPILAKMDPAAAERVTMEIAAQGQKSGEEAESLPKITGEKPR